MHQNVLLVFQPEEFRQKVEKYIQTKDHDAGMQYWPIVKHVRLRMPDCDACSSGAVLVDLPGVRDSNAARDKIAKEVNVCCRNCTARQCSPLRRKFMECTINNLALSLLMKHLVIGQCQKAPYFSTFHWSPHSSLVSIGQHFVTMRIVHLPKRSETSLITESDQSGHNHQLLQLCTAHTA